MVRELHRLNVTLLDGLDSLPSWSTAVTQAE
jgi:hypothetical protein